MRAPRKLTIVIWIIAIAVIGGTAGVWWEPLRDVVMYRTKTRYADDGKIRSRIYMARWGAREGKTLVWYSNGQLATEVQGTEERHWDADGRLRAAHCSASGHGVMFYFGEDFEPLIIERQVVSIAHQTVHTVTSPPWLTEEQIERALAGQWP